MESIRQIAFKFLLPTVFFFIPIIGFSFSSNTTHPAITGQGVDFYNNFVVAKITENQKEWLKKGSIEEDNNTRSLFHFYDPINNRGIKGFRSAKTWANYSSNDFSWNKALQAYINGEEEKAYVALGHIIHLLQDMFVPDHTRDDAHMFNDESVFEIWAGENKNKETLGELSKKLINEGFTPKKADSIDEYFDSSAGYSNSNFFSTDTIFESAYSNPVETRRTEKYVFGSDNIFNEEHLLLKTSKDLKGNDLYILLDRNDSSVVSDYFTRLSTQAILVQAGVMELFFKEAEQLRIEQQSIKQENVIQLFFKNIKKNIDNSLSLVISSSVGPGVATVIESRPALGSDEIEAEITFTREVINSDEIIESLPQTMSDQELEDMIGVKREEIIKIIELLKETEVDQQENISVSINKGSFSFGGGGTSSQQTDEDSNSDNSTTTEEIRHSISVLSPQLIPKTFATSTITFSGTTSPYSHIIQNDNSTTTADKDGVWSHSVKLLDGQNEIYFTSVLEDKIATTTVYIINVRLLKDGPEISESSCIKSFVKEKCVLAEDGFHFKISTTTDSVFYKIIFENNYSTTTESENSLKLNSSKNIINLISVDELGFDSATTTLEVEYVPNPVVINEIAWAGEASSSDEWIELFNKTNYQIDLDNWEINNGDETFKIKLTGHLDAKAYYLIENKSASSTDEAIDSPVIDVTANLWTYFGSGLKDSGEKLTLVFYVSETSEVIESDMIPFCENWCGYGNDLEKNSMERWSVDLPSDWWQDVYGATNWSSSIGYWGKGINKNGRVIKGTPGSKNSISYKPVNGTYFFGDIVLKKENSPYLIDGMFYVGGATSTVKIEKGVHLKFINSDSGEGILASEGQVIVDGDISDPVIFTTLDDDKYSPQLSISNRDISAGGLYIFDQPVTSILSNLEFHNMLNGVSFFSSSGSIQNLSMTGGKGIKNFGADLSIDGLNMKDIIDGAVGSYDYLGVYPKLFINNSNIDSVIDGFAIGSFNGDLEVSDVNIKNIDYYYGVLLDGENTYKMENLNIEKDNGVAVNSYGGGIVEILNSSFISSNYADAGVVSDGQFKSNNIKVEGFDNGIIISNGSAKIKNSEISNNLKGISIYADPQGVEINQSNIFGNLEFGLQNYSFGNIDAKSNWWGDMLGPDNESEEYEGIGDKVLGEIDFSDFLGMKVVY